MKKVLLASAALSFAWTGAALADITIATGGPMTGDYATFGAQMSAGAKQAVEDINAAGGVLGEQLTLMVEDDRCDPKEAVAVANRVAAAGAVLMAGHFCSGSSIPASTVYSEEGVIQISPASTNPAFTEERPGPGIYRVCGRDDQQGEVAGAYINDTFKDQKVAIINDKSAYGKGLADETQKAMEAAGKQADMVESYTAGEQDYTALVTKMKNEGIGVVYVGGYHTEAGLIKRQMNEAGMDAILVSGDALVTDEYWQITGDAGAGTLMTFSPDPRQAPGAAELVEKFRADGIEPEGYTLYTYAAIQAWAQAAETAKSTDHAAIVTALDAGTFETVLGTLEFDDKGDVSLPGYVFYEWEAGKYNQMSDAGGAMDAAPADAMAPAADAMAPAADAMAPAADAMAPAEGAEQPAQ
ncbi:MAG: branched-chain amino acid ABC transporter substrate-binding protein [Pseudomonadota bacterium]|nr:branched-chain amino acid ABC transporter substrate-binding protein [Pseudomonadota bacterium]